MAAVGAICQHGAEVHVIFVRMTGITTQAYNLYTIGIKLNLITTKKHLQSFASSFLYFLIIIIGNATVVDVTLRLNFETDIAQTKEGVVQFFLYDHVCAY